MSEVVLDSSALLAALHEEAGCEKVEPLLGAAAVSAVNWSEVVQKSLSRGVRLEGLRADMEALGLDIIPFTAEDAEIAADLWKKTHRRGLSLGDRSCLSLGIRLGLPVVTADKAWKGLGAGIEIQVIR
ncbi:MAG: type II toxin-antitoxin system VapC family toxin [Deltaproteobacteria bacterium]|nr:type II toxin-antitoxin system VapC family toxin [Deltaproteobacteria bacterium]